MKNKFFSTCIGIAVILFAAGFFVRSFNSAQAEPRPEKFLAEGTNSIGRYMMHFQEVQGLTSNDSPEYNVLVWDTETGKSKWYYYSYTEKTFKVSTAGLPASPLQ
jgi:hypothetical protein